MDGMIQMYLPRDARDAAFRGIVTSSGLSFELKMDGSLSDLSWSILLALLDHDDPDRGLPPKLIQADRSGADSAVSEQLVLFKMMRHDLRNKMVTVRGSLDIYQRNKDERYFEKAVRNLEACDEMISRMSMLYRSLESPNELRQIDLRDMADSVVRNYLDSGVEFNVTGEGHALADEAVIHVIDNLISNALRHAAPGRIDVSISQSNDKVMIKVADDGGGIPEDIRPRLFQEGFRFGTTGNTGMGLFIIRCIVQRYKGRIWVEENRPKGSVFCVELRRAEAS